MTKAIIYTRFSPRRNAEDSESCEIQEQQCRNYCEQKGYTVAQVFHDPDVSGGDAFRPQLWSAIKALGKGDALIVYKRDRLARSVMLAEMINAEVEKSRGFIEAVSGDIAGDTPEANMARQMAAVFSEYFRRMNAERTSAAMKQHQRNGKKMGGNPPFGYRVDPEDAKRIIEHPVEMRAIKLAIALRDQKRYAPAQIIHFLNEKLPEAARGKQFYQGSFLRAVAKYEANMI